MAITELLRFFRQFWTQQLQRALRSAARLTIDRSPAPHLCNDIQRVRLGSFREGRRVVGFVVPKGKLQASERCLSREG